MANVEDALTNRVDVKCESGGVESNETSVHAPLVNGSSDANNGRGEAASGQERDGATQRAGSGDEVRSQESLDEDDGDDESRSKTEKIRDIVEQCTSEDSKKKINRILTEVRQLPDLEKLLLYLQLPTGIPAAPVDPAKHATCNPLGNRFEVTQTVTWIKTHLEEDPEVSLPKHEIYEEYCVFCLAHKIKPLSTADFGKVMKQVFPNVRPRRLGTRGNSRYCYAGLRKRMSLDCPKLPSVAVSRDNNPDEALSLRGVSEDIISACSYVILDWAFKLLEQKFDSLKELAYHLVESNVVDVRSVGAFTILSLLPTKGKGNQASVLLSQSGGNKHRETQLQLQRKLQEKELIREQRRRMQEIKGDRPPTKERKRAASGPCSRVVRHTARAGCSQPPTPLPHRESPPLISAVSCDVASDKGATDLACSKRKREVRLPNGKGDAVATSTTPSVSSEGEAKSRRPSGSDVSISSEGDAKSRRPSGSDIQISLEKAKVGKVQIPRIPSNRQSPKVCLAAPHLIIVPHVPSQAKQKPKYKPIQPKPPCSDETSLKRLSDDTEMGDSPKKPHLEFQETVPSDSSAEPVLEDPSFIDRVACELFTQRDPIMGDPVVGEPAMRETDNGLMDYLDGSSASLDQDEELSQYFSESNPRPSGDGGQSAQISQLRRLLEHNLRPTVGVRAQARSHTLRELLTQPTPAPVAPVPKEEPTSRPACPAMPARHALGAIPLTSVEEITGYSLAQHGFECTPMSSSNSSPMTSIGGVAARRRVSFPSNLVVAGGGGGVDGPSSVPPSPTTRCRALNFTPISPRHTPIPDGAQKPTAPSQPASATASPFVSPRSTPIPQCRSRHNSGQAPSSSFCTTPRSTPYPPSEQSSMTPSPFISPHPTPVPFTRSRHNSSQNMMHRQSSFVAQIAAGNVLGQSRSRHSSGAALALLSPCSAPLSPMNPVPDSDNTASTQFSLPTLGDTPQMRSRHNSNSSIPPQSPRSAPMSPQALPPPGLPSLYPLDSDSFEWTQQSWMASRHRHASTGATVHHLPTGMVQSTQLQDSSDAAGLLHRSQSVPLYEMLQNVNDMNQMGPDQHFSQSYQATSAAAVPNLCQPPPPLPQGLVSDSFSTYLESPSMDRPPEQYVGGQNNNDVMESRPPSVADDLQATWEDLQACDNDFSKFAQELEQQYNGNGGGGGNL